MWHSTRPFRLFLPPALSVDWRLPRSLSHWSTGHAITSGPRLSAQVAGQTNQDLLVLVNETTKDFELSPLLKTLTTELTSHHIPTRMAALRWRCAFSPGPTHAIFLVFQRINARITLSV